MYEQQIAAIPEGPDKEKAVKKSSKDDAFCESVSKQLKLFGRRYWYNSVFCLMEYVGRFLPIPREERSFSVD
ncbi:MAG: hypothetical protein ACJA0U_003430 [Salibacteraceae bacterium]|jgi:hypothetical protein